MFELSDVLEFYLELKVRTQKLEEPGFRAWIAIRTTYRNFTQTNHIRLSSADQVPGLCKALQVSSVSGKLATLPRRP